MCGGKLRDMYYAGKDKSQPLLCATTTEYFSNGRMHLVRDRWVLVAHFRGVLPRLKGQTEDATI